MLTKITTLAARHPLLAFTFSKQQPKPTPQPKAPQPKAPQLKLSEKPSHLKASAIESEMPELYQTLLKQAEQLEKETVKNHSWKLGQLKKRISEDSIGRVKKISEILDGLSCEEQEYIKMAIIKRVENLE